MIQIISALLPIILLPRLVRSHFWSNLNNRQWIVIGTLMFVGQFFPSLILLLQDMMRGLDAIFRSLNVFLAFLMIPAFTSNVKRFRQILLAFVLAGIAPLLVSLYGELSGTVWHVRKTVDLYRNIGLYHNAVSIRHFGLQSILVSIMYLSFFPPRRVLIRIILIVFALLSTYMLYKGYTRGGLVTLIAWGVILAIAYRKLFWALFTASVLVAYNHFTNGLLLDEILQLFSKEVTFYESGYSDSSKVLNGRVGMWSVDMREWADQDLLYIIFGGNHSGLGSHNEILRTLIANGIIGLGLYLVSIVTIAYWTIRKLFSTRERNLAVFSFMILTMYSLEAFGSTPGAFPQFQWFVFGLLGTLMLNGSMVLDKGSLRLKSRQKLRPRKPLWLRYI